MNLTPPKLKPLHIAIIAALLVIIVGAAMANFWIMPIMKDNKAVQAELDTVKVEGDPARDAEAEQDILKATNEALRTQQSWRARQRRYFLVGPNRRPIDLSQPFQTLTDTVAMEHRQTLVPILQSWARRHNVQMSDLNVAGANNNPNSLKDYEDKPYRFDFQNVKVTGTFPRILAMLRDTESLPRLVSLRNVTLTAAQSNTDPGSLVQTANTGTVTADLSFTVYVFTQGKFVEDKRFPAPQAAGGGAPGMAPMPGGPAMPGGPPVGPPMPGGPPVGPPMPGGPPAPGGAPTPPL